MTSFSTGKVRPGCIFQRLEMFNYFSNISNNPSEFKSTDKKKKRREKSSSSMKLLENYDAYLPRPFSSMYMGGKYV